MRSINPSWVQKLFCLTSGTRDISKKIWVIKFQEFEILIILISLNQILPRFMYNFLLWPFFKSILKVTSLCRAEESRGTRFPRNLKVSQEILILYPAHLLRNMIHLGQPKLHEKTILSHKKNSPCDRKNTVYTQRMSDHCKRRNTSSYGKYTLCHRKAVKWKLS